MSAALEAVVVRQLAGLRQANWSLVEALDFVTAELPASALKQRLQGALAAVRAGAAAPSTDLLVATLTRGDAASARVLEQLADALETGDDARSSTTLVRGAVTLVLTVCTLVVVVTNVWFVGYARTMFAEIVSFAALPAPTQLYLDASGTLQTGAPIALLIALVVVWRARFDSASGGRELRASSLLMQFAAAVEAGVAEPMALALIDPKSQRLATSVALRLDENERAFLSQVSASSGAAEAARRLGVELAARGAQRSGQRPWWTSPALVVLVVFTALFFFTTLMALYLPIFSLSSAIK